MDFEEVVSRLDSEPIGRDDPPSRSGWATPPRRSRSGRTRTYYPSRDAMRRPRSRR